MDLGREKEAHALRKEAEKMINPSFLGLRLKGDWPQATPLFERAGLLFRQSGDHRGAHECFEKAAQGHIAQRSAWHAAKAMERAAEASRDGGNIPSSTQAFDRAAELNLEEGRPESAAEVAVKAAAMLESSDAKEASRQYERALEWLEDAGKDTLHGDVYRQAISHAVRARRWAEAAALLLRFAVSCDRSGASMSQKKAYLGAVVVWLAAENAAAAWATYQDALAVSEFASGDEAFAAEELFKAYRAGDAEAVTTAIKTNHCFVHLDPAVARLAKKLPVGDLLKAAAELGGGGGADEQGEEDLT